MGIIISQPVDEEEKFELIKRWAEPIILGPILPALYAIILIVCGTFVIQLVTLDCVTYIDVFIQGTIALSYLYLMIFSWSYIGFEYNINLGEKTQVPFLLPFTSLRYLSIVYALFLLLIIIWWTVGSFFAGTATACFYTSKKLYIYYLIVLMSGWFFILMGIWYIYNFEVKDKRIRRAYYKGTEDDEDDDMKVNDSDELSPEEQILESKFDEFDKDGSGEIEATELGSLLGSIGIELSGEELKTTMMLLDGSGDGQISFEELLKWYRMSPLQRRKWLKKAKDAGFGQKDAPAADDDDDDDDDNDEDDDD